MGAEQDFRSLRGISAFPDLMNDPAYATNTDSKGKGIEEPDTCRICRGEGSEEEQLFYPCKCSGSIKFVHQSCLMEWLSHSQKKYCELCKTPFRFTKLYDPGMPSKLPAQIFIRELAIHGLRSLITWLRLVLVAFVWLGWLPWSMRAIWRALFWLADGRWPNPNFVQAPLPTANLSDIQASSVADQTLSSDTAASSATQTVSSVLNISNEEPLGFAVAKRILLKILLPTLSTSTGSNASQVSSIPSGRVRQPSWLSNVTFLNSLTPSPTVNNIVIDTLEGQLITLLVVVSFILVFLIREWVVQQQPAVNLAEDEQDAVVRLMAENRNQAAAALAAPLEERNMPFNDDIDLAQADHEQDVHDYAINDDESRASSAFSSPRLMPADYRPRIQIRTSSRPTLRSRNALDDASNIRRTIEETVNEPDSPTWPGIETFKDLWLRGEGNPDEILRIIQEEGREDELSWVVNAMTTLKRGNATRRISSGNFDFSDHHEEVSHEGPSSINNRHSNSDLLNNANSDSSYEILESMAPLEISNSGPSQTVNFELPRETIDWSEGEEETTFERATITENAPAPVVVEEAALQPRSGVANASVPESGTPQLQEDAIAAPRTFTNRVFDWFWGDLETPQEPDTNVQDVEHVVVDAALEEPFVPLPNRQNAAANAPAPNPWREPAAPPPENRNPNDVDAVEEGDDFEGILELIGIQGPIFGLLQNGVFLALLISFTIAVGIWLPYLWGKIALVFFTSPVRLVVRVPLAMLSITADVIVDSLIGSFGYVLYLVSFITRNLLRPVAGFVPFLDRISQSSSFTQTSLSLIDGSSQRLKRVLGGFFDFQDSDLPMFSVLAHQALRIHEARISNIFQFIFDGVKLILHDIPIKLLSADYRNSLFVAASSIDMTATLASAKDESIDVANSLFSLFARSELDEEAALLIRPDYDLAQWDTKDRIIAIVIGYVFASLLGIFYLRVTGFFTGANRGQRPEGVVAEILNQAGGVMKVILIIGIEMLVFPLYSGLLLDLALMPLFENATLASRVAFTLSSPLTSLFVHWFIGTCYMFHFALFVSMCRKIMRTGVLYFIRDPDDPNFHPVRDVLERDIITQLRKIAFSALVYGGLVVICLGAVVWGLSYTFENVLPIHWSSNTPILEVPVDLLFYNFVMPVILRAIKPSDGLHNMYDWWFHKCARYLRLSQFLLGERNKDEEGRSIGRTWRDILFGNLGDVENPITTDEDLNAEEKKGKSPRFLRDGKFVRAPASDQVRIPKGIKVFLEVSEDNERTDGNIDSDEGLHGRKSKMFTQVYIPPNFRLRIFVFIFLIWVFAAVTGVGVTIFPLVVGRRVLSSFFPHVTRMNDIYAFSVGISMLLSAGYTVVYLRVGYQKLQNGLQPMLSNSGQVISEVTEFLLHAMRLVYLSAVFVILIPSLCALLTELYVLVPIHTYTNGQQAHVIHFVQDWALGVLYVQMAYMFLQWRSNSRAAVALHTIVNDGWLQPNTALATRALIIPALIFTFLAVSLPLGFGAIAKATMFPEPTTVSQSTVYRYSYPATLAACLVMYALYLLRRQVNVWRANIRDEMYLIGERLHNFGEKRARDVTGVNRRVSTS
uniref:RING-type E3 ubiquitin transferase n=1 Tax=Talaromyces marneffei PM1 TaxID=1077442 RepID=A0A093V5E7_TALMA